MPTGPLALTRLPVRSARRFLRGVRDRLRGETTVTYFDLYNPAELDPFLTERQLPALSADPTQADAGPDGAVRFLLGSLIRTPGLKWYFPRPLTEGSAFANWALRRPLSPRGAENVRAVFDNSPGVRVRRVFELREDLRGVFPLALTPAGRRQYLGWLLSFGLKDFPITPEAALWFQFELDEDPTRGLAATYRLQPEWQAAVPHALTRFGWPALKAWVGDRYKLSCRWLREATLPPTFGPLNELRLLAQADPFVPPLDQPDAVLAWAKNLPGADRDWLAALAAELRSPPPGVNVLGLFRYTSGLQQAVRGSVAALHRVGVRTSLRDYPVPFLREPRDLTAYDGLEPFDITVVNTGIDTPVSDAYRKSGLHLRPGVHRVGMWWWEMETLPDAWRDRGNEVDEIWAPTQFIADAMRATFDKPVYPMLPGFALPAFDPLPKAHFGLDPDKFAFVFVFDMNSRMQRKNPTGLIAAFRRAFRRDEPVELVIKVSPPESYYKDQWEILRTTAAAEGVTLLDRVLSRGELLAFLAAADAYASLHRSEGFGLTCAEAMLLGKPVVATAYSGNLDFMTAENSYLVDYRRVALEEDIDPYPKGAVWADPDIDHAARQMRAIYDDRDTARRTGERAQAELRDVLSVEAAGRRMAARLTAIMASRPA